MPRLLTFDGPELDAVLARVRKEAGPEAKITSATKVRSGGIGGFFVKEAFKVVVEVPDEDAPAPTAEPATDPRQIWPDSVASSPPSSLLELADLVDEAEASAVEVHVPVEREPQHVPSTEKPTFHAVLRRIASEAGAPVPADVPLPEAVVEAVQRPVPTLAAPRSAELLALGLPESMLPTDLSPGQAVAALLRSLRLPSTPPLPSEAGAVTVVVGDRRAAARLAADVAAELQLSKRDVRVAEAGPERPDRLVTPAEALAQRRTWTGGPTVVAMTAPAGSRDLRWAESMLDALEPSAVWGVVGADRKPEDVLAWSDALGGIDALALEHLDATVSPASVLQLGIPVARLEGQKATPALWAVLLAERIAA